MSEIMEGHREVRHSASDPHLDVLSATVVELARAYGRSPTAAASWRPYDDCVVTALEDFMTPAEQALVKDGEAMLVRQLRRAFGQAVTDEYVRAAEAALGRSVVAHHSDIVCASGTCLETFVLAGGPGVPG